MSITRYIKYFLFFPLLLLLWLPICKAQTFKINGRLEQVSDVTMATLRYFDIDKNDYKADTAIINNQTFSFEGNVRGGCYTSIIFFTKKGEALKDYTLIIEPGNINVLLKSFTQDKMTVSGSSAHEAYENYKKLTAYESTALQKISESINVIDSLLINAVIDTEKAQKMRKEVSLKTPELYTSEFQKIVSYIKENRDSYVSMMEFTYLIGRAPVDSIDTWYASLSNKVKDGNADKEFIKKFLKYRKAIAAEYPFDLLKLQEPAPAFSIYKNAKKDSLGVKDFAGKVLVLELWGITCVPCLYGNLALEKIRSKYTADQIQIISLAKTSPGDIPAINNYIRKNNFDQWMHVALNNDANENLVSLLEGNFSNYIGLGIPKTIVIDQTGRLVYKADDYAEAQMAAVEKLIASLIQ